MSASRQPSDGTIGWGRALVVAGALAVLAVLIAATLLLIGSGPDAPLGDAWGFRGFLAILALAFAGPGGVLVIRVPGNRVGTLMLGIGVWASFVSFVVEYAAHGLVVEPGSLPAAEFAGWLTSWAWVPFGALCTTMLPLIFPDGHLLSPGWRMAAALSIGSIALLSVTLAVRPGPIDNAPYFDNPLGVSGPLGDWVLSGTLVGFLLMALALALSAVSVVVRFRRSTGPARQQLKWFAAAGVFAAFTLAGPGTLLNVLFTGDATRSMGKTAEILTIIAIGSIPLATGVAILRYRLYEIDRIISRGVSWAAVSGLLVLVFVVLVLGFQAILEPFTGGSTLAVAASTLVVAAATQPLARRVQSIVDRRFFRAHYDAVRTIDAFVTRLRSEVDLRSIGEDVAATVTGTVRPAALHFWIRDGGTRSPIEDPARRRTVRSRNVPGPSTVHVS